MSLVVRRLSARLVNSATYIATIRAEHSEPWTLEQLLDVACEALSRWRHAREHLQMSFGFPPRISAIEPSFALSPDLSALAPSEDDTRLHSVALGYLSWATCQRTHELPNPYEPLLALLHHGGTFSTEDIFLDICSASGDRAGIPMLNRNATSVAEHGAPL